MSWQRHFIQPWTNHSWVSFKAKVIRLYLYYQNRNIFAVYGHQLIMQWRSDYFNRSKLKMNCLLYCHYGIYPPKGLRTTFDHLDVSIIIKLFREFLLAWLKKRIFIILGLVLFIMINQFNIYKSYKHIILYLFIIKRSRYGKCYL